MRSLIAFLAMTVVIFCVGATQAEDTLSTLNRVERYLNGMKTLSADFTQIDPQGTIATGVLHLQRPGKMRWDYDPPTPILMVSNGETLTYYDYELDQISYLSLDDTLAGFLTRPRINFADDALRVVDVREGAGTIRLSILQTARLDEGSLSLLLNTDPIALKQLSLVDATGQLTTITLENVRLDETLDDSLFEFDNPRKFGVRGRRD